MFDKGLPQALEAEKALLGVLLGNNKLIDEIEGILKVESFYKETHGKIYTTILDMWRSKKYIDLVTLEEKLEKDDQLSIVGGATYLLELLDAPSCIDLEVAKNYVGIINEKAIWREILNIGMFITSQAYQAKGDAIEVITKAIEKLTQLGTKLAEKGPERLRKRKLSPFSFIETPFPALNKIITGFWPGELTIVASRPEVDKVALLLEFLKFAALKERAFVLYFSTATSKTIYNRVLSSLSGINFRDILRAKINNEQSRALADAQSKIDAASILVSVLDKKNLNPIFIASQIASQINKWGSCPILVIIENLQEIVWLEKTQTLKEAIDNIVYFFRETARELNLPIILSSYLGRQVDDRPDKKPRLSDLVGSGGIEEKADKVLLLYPNNQRMRKEKGGKNLERVKIIIAKGGAPKEIELVYSRDTLSFLP